MSENKIHVNFDDNVLMYVIDKSDIPDYLGTLPPEEQEVLNKKNDTWINTVLEPAILRTMDICSCSMQEFMMRNERKRQILNVPPQAFQPQLEQADVDRYRFSVIIIADKDEMQEISAIVRECKQCHKITYWGNVAIFGKLLADITNNFYSKDENDDPFATPDVTEDLEVTPENPLGKDTFLEDLDSANPLETGTLEPSEISEEPVE